MDIESLVGLFDSIAPARGDHWNIKTLVPERLHLTKSDEGLFAVFVEGAKESFGSLPSQLAVEYSDSVIALPERRRVSAMRINAGNEPHANRVIAHIAYELNWALQKSPAPDNRSLVSGIGWLLSLIASSGSIMSVELQKGLVGECMLLRWIVLHGQRRGKTNVSCLQAWHGHDRAKRDFFAKGVAIEAKATGNATRLHHISSLDQLAPQEAGESVYLFSVGIRQDASAPRKLPQYLEDVESLLVDQSGNPDALALAHFRKQLKAYGFDWADRSIYERQHGFLAPHLPPALFRETDLRRLTESDFVEGKLPETVRSLSYDLEIVAPTLSNEEIEAVLDELLAGV
jgi:hypothetical protein